MAYFPPAIYGGFRYGETYYGWNPGFPSFAPWDVFDFAYPSTATMLSLFSFPETIGYRFTPGYGWFSASDDYCMRSDDSSLTGFRVQTALPKAKYSFEFSLLPTALPVDFSSTSDRRVFVAVFNSYSKTVGLLLSEDGGIALASSGDGAFTVFGDSADIFSEGLDYYVFRVVVDIDLNRANLYVTRQDVLTATGVHELRYTFTPLETPSDEVDNFRVEVFGTAGDPTEVCLDYIRCSSEEVITNRRPVAIIDDDHAVVLGQYGSFDGRASYDPDSPPADLAWWWTITSAPDNSIFKHVGNGTTPADSTGLTHIIEGAAGTFSTILEGDLLVGDEGTSVIMRVADDGSWVAATNDVMVASSTPEWTIFGQSGWGGIRITGTAMIDVASRLATPPPTPAAGDMHLIIATATDGWAGHEGEVATYVSGDPALELSWTYALLAADKLVFVGDEKDAYRTAGGGVWRLGDPKGWELDHWEGRTAAVAPILGDVTSLYNVELIVTDGVRDSLPVTALLNIYQTDVPLGLTPDLSFLWNYLSDFWSVVADREPAETFWSASAQVLIDELMKLWQHDYSKSLLDIQRTFQRRWLNFDPWYEEPNYEEDPATIENSVNSAGYAASPTPASPDADASRVYVLDSGDLPTGTSDVHYVVLEGLAYKIVRTQGDNLITSDTLPTTDRSSYWMIRPSVTSKSSNFSSLGVTAGDLAVFEVRDEDGALDDVTSHVWGARGNVLIFDDTNLSGQLASDTYTVRFKGVLRRTAIAVDDLVSSMPRLQEVIALDRVDGAPDPLLENLDFRVEQVTTVEEATVNTIQMTDSWYTQQLRGFAGYTDASDHSYFYDASVDFEDTFGAAADLRGYVLELDGIYYRLYQVISATQVELMDDALELNLTGQKWWIRSMDDPPNHLWSELTHLDNRPVIDGNFGRLIGFTLDDLEARTDNLDYLSAVQGLWYYVWGPKTPYQTRIGSQIILGLPFAEVPGFITDIQEPFDATRSRILIQDEDNNAIVRSYTFPTVFGIEDNPNTGEPYSLGEYVEQFSPLSRGVTVSDYLTDPDWFEVYVASRDLYEVQKVHTWGVLIDADVFDLTNLVFLVNFLRQYQPKYADVFFSVVRDTTEEFDISDVTVTGPAAPVAFTYPDTWPDYPAFAGFVGSPHEVTRAAVDPYDPGDSSTWVTNPPVPYKGYPFGGVHLGDVPGSAPDGWANSDIPAGALGSWDAPPLGPYQAGYGGADSIHAPTISEGTFEFDDISGHGHTIHRFTDAGNNLLLDGDFEPGLGDPGAPSSPWDVVDVGGLGLAFSATKTGPACPLVSGSTQSLAIVGVGTHHGIEQPLDGVGNHPGPTAVDLNFQVGARLYLYLLSGQAYIRILNQDSPQTVLAEWRHASPPVVWREIDLHAWRAPQQDTNYLSLQILTGPAGGSFYVDGVGLYQKLMPWPQWGYDMAYGGRTGGYTTGGLPDDVCEMQLAVWVP